MVLVPNGWGAFKYVGVIARNGAARTAAAAALASISNEGVTNVVSTSSSCQIAILPQSTWYYFRHASERNKFMYLIDEWAVWVLLGTIPIGTFLCIFLCSIIFIIQLFHEYNLWYDVNGNQISLDEALSSQVFISQQRNSIKESYALEYQSLAANKEYFRILTSHFLHSTWTHLLHNMYGAYSLGADYEEAFGTFRLIEATFWSIFLGGVWVLLAMTFNPSMRQSKSLALGFSEILYFWMSLGYDVSRQKKRRRGFVNANMVVLVGRELLSLSDNNGGAAFHLMGFFNGLFYKKYIRHRFSISHDSSVVVLVENILDWSVGRVCKLLRLKEYLGPYVVEAAPIHVQE